MSTAKVIRKGRMRLGMNPEQFAKAVGVTRGAVQHWERDDGTAPNRKHQPKVARLLGITVAELLTGAPASGSPLTVPVVAEPRRHGEVDVEDLTQNVVDHAPALTEVKDRTFAYRVHGDSMVCGADDSFPNDSVVVVEPDLAPRPGDFVVAQCDSDGLMLRQLVKEGGDHLLKPLNSRYPIKPLDEAHVLGVVKEFSKIYRSK
jgi:SOS-response transcriptional repressor LexA